MGASLLRYVLSKLDSDLNPKSIDRIETQASKEGKGSVPDGLITTDNFKLILESKLDCSIRVTQLKQHVKLLKKENYYLIYITNHPVRPTAEELPEEVFWTNWDTIASWLIEYETSDVILSYLISQFQKLIDSLFKDVKFYKSKGILRISDNPKFRDYLI